MAVLWKIHHYSEEAGASVSSFVSIVQQKSVFFSKTFLFLLIVYDCKANAYILQFFNGI